MIKHGIPKEYIDENPTEEIIKVRQMEDCLEKHEKMVLLNPDDYNSWNYLKRHFSIFKEEGFVLKQMELTQRAIMENPKSYHSWFHRHLFFQHLTNGMDDNSITNHEMNVKKEIGLCKMLLKFDPRNFHCWNYCKKNHFRIENNLHNFTSMHYSNFDESVLFLDPNDEGGWCTFEKVNYSNEASSDVNEFTNCNGNEYTIKIVGRMRIGKLNGEITFEEPFKGTIKINGKEIETKQPTKRIQLATNELSQAVATNEQLQAVATNEPATVQATQAKTKETQELNDTNSLICNSDVVKIKKYVLPNLIDKILNLEPNCVYALKHKMIYSQDDEERRRIVEILKREDPMRKEYYEFLCKDKYEQYILISVLDK